jgi:hypothetical protein
MCAKAKVSIERNDDHACMRSHEREDENAPASEENRRFFEPFAGRTNHLACLCVNAPEPFVERTNRTKRGTLL